MVVEVVVTVDSRLAHLSKRRPPEKVAAGMSLPRLPDSLPAGYTVHPQVLKLIATPQYIQRTPEWYEVRKGLMTASNAAAALGIKPYDSFRGDPKAACIDQIVSGSFKGNAATRHGCEHEDAVRDRYCAIAGETALEFGLIVHREFPWLAASPDGITLNGQMIEIKCPRHRDIVPGHVPHHYYPQVQTQMEVCDLDSCAFVQWKPARFTKDAQEIFDVVIVPRDRAWFARHKEDLLSFYHDLMRTREQYVPPLPPPCLIRDTLYDHLTAPTSMMLDDSD